MTRTVVCLDFDGTLVDEEGRIHPADVEMLTAARDVLVVPATGRPLHAVRAVFERAGLFTDGPLPFPLILQNGAAVYLPGEVLHAHAALAAPDRETLLEATRRHPEVCGLFFGLGPVAVLQPNDLARHLARRFDLDLEPFDAESTDRTFLKMSFAATRPAAMEAFVAATEHVPVEKYFSIPTLIEMTARGTNKGSVLRALLDAMAVAPERVLVAGDGENDLPLFDVADRTFAPASSPAPIRRRADEVVDIAKDGILRPMLASGR